MQLNFNTFWNEKQKLMFKILLDNKNGITDVWYWWAAWWWKSYWWVAWQWMLRTTYPWTKGFFGRKELKRLKQTTLETYFKFCSEYNIPENQRWIYNAQNWEITYNNWSKILLLDLSYMPSDPEYTRFGSLEFTDWFADEIWEINSKALMILKTRIWRQKNDEYWLLPKFLWTFNPDKWHVYKDYYKPWKDWKLPHYRVFIPALATDNQKLSKQYIEELKKADEVTKQRLLYWNFDYDNTPGRLFDYEKILDLFTNQIYWWNRCISADIARKWKDLAVILVWNWLKVIEKVVYKTCTLTEIQNKIKSLCLKYSIGMSSVIVDEDWVWWWVVDNLNCKWFINNSSPLESQKQNLNYQNLKTQCYFKLAELTNQNLIWFEENVFTESEKESIIQELDIIVEKDLDKDWKKKIISKDEIKEKIWRSPDFSDSIMMRMFFELKAKSKFLFTNL